jgi:protein-disulfide isomerase
LKKNNKVSMKIVHVITSVVLGVATLYAAAADDIRPANALGPANAPVTVEFFSDMQCPQCARYEPMVKSLKTEFGDKVRMVLRHCPLTGHAHSMLAACAAEAAANQGKFWEMADALYKTQWMWGNAPAPRAMLVDQAKELGLNLDRFQKDLDSPECHDRVVDDLDYGRDHGVKGAPSVLVNGYNVPNTEFSENGFRAAIKAALAKAGQ